MHRIALIWGHAGKTERQTPDPGASTDVDGDGVIAEVEKESHLILPYLAGCHRRLAELGHWPVLFADGSYSARAARVAAWRSSAILHLHLDVRPTPAARLFCDPASQRSQGPSLAAHVGRAIETTFPELAPARAIAATETSSPGGLALCKLHRTDPAPVLVLEPLTIDMAGRWYLQGRLDRLDKLGATIADGVHAWLAT